MVLLSLGQRLESLGWLEVMRWNSEEKKNSDRALKICKGSLKYWLNTDLHAKDETTRDLGKNYWKEGQVIDS